MSLYFDEESKEWKLLKSVPDVGEVVEKWSSVKYIGNCLYLASSNVVEPDFLSLSHSEQVLGKTYKVEFPQDNPMFVFCW